jgi:NAD(P)-dependent dehydrogenase (short-subunit alcohol dehydrogenase family)
MIRIETIPCDLTAPVSVEAAYRTAHTSLGRIDYSIHSAGIFVRGGPSTECSVEDFDKQNDIAYRGLWLCARQALTFMKTQNLDCEAYPEANIPPHRSQRGAIVNISSQLARGWQRGKQAYIASKAAVVALTHCDALDYVEDRIRVNCVLPGVIETPMTTSTAEARRAAEAGSVARTPMGRFGVPEEVADTVVFLAGNRSSFTTGAEFVVDGGYCAQ